MHEVNSNNSLTNRGRAIAAMGLVSRDYEGFNVTSPGFRKETFRIWKDEEGKVKCSCAEHRERITNEPKFRCEHIIAVKFHLENEEAKAEITTEDKKQMDLNEFINQLDATCPDWSHQVVSIKQIGDLVAVTASVTIQGVTRQGIGTGSAYEETGIKNAEYDALKRAAIKFGVARQILNETIKTEETPKGFAGDPMAKTMAELITPRQMVAIRAISNGQKLDPEDEIKELFGQSIKVEELSKKAASALIEHLKIDRSTQAASA